MARGEGIRRQAASKTDQRRRFNAFHGKREVYHGSMEQWQRGHPPPCCPATKADPPVEAAADRATVAKFGEHHRTPKNFKSTTES
mmetsp:Transcript_31353/g.47043  ORF Transcript_31353/g.47043 Transcript_31353/m.47043 type:complete len:85 (-) Transcript_31353:13-267(-)